MALPLLSNEDGKRLRKLTGSADNTIISPPFTPKYFGTTGTFKKALAIHQLIQFRTLALPYAPYRRWPIQWNDVFFFWQRLMPFRITLTSNKSATLLLLFFYDTGRRSHFPPVWGPQGLLTNQVRMDLSAQQTRVLPPENTDRESSHSLCLFLHSGHETRGLPDGLLGRSAEQHLQKLQNAHSIALAY